MTCLATRVSAQPPSPKSCNRDAAYRARDGVKFHIVQRRGHHVIAEQELRTTEMSWANAARMGGLMRRSMSAKGGNRGRRGRRVAEQATVFSPRPVSVVYARGRGLARTSISLLEDAALALRSCLEAERVPGVSLLLDAGIPPLATRWKVDHSKDVRCSLFF
jgi:hypothetical protein